MTSEPIQSRLREVLRSQALLVAIPSLLVPVSLGRPQEPPSFPAKAQLVTIDALVLDRDGRPVSGLAAGDFVVIEDGVPQEIASFDRFDLGPPHGHAASTAPLEAGPVVTNLRTSFRGARTFVLLVDDVGIASHREKDLREVIERFVSEGLRDGDELLFLTTSGDLRWTARKPEGQEDMWAVAARIRGRKLSEAASSFMSEWEAYQISRFESPSGARLESSGLPVSSYESGIALSAPTTSTIERVVTRWLQRRYCDPDAVGPGGKIRPGVPVCRSQAAGRARMIDQARVQRTRQVLARIDEAVFALSFQRGRKALLLLTEGFLNDPDVDVLSVVSARCREANVAVYSLDVRGLVPVGDELGAASSPGAPDGPEQGLMRHEQLYSESAGNAALAEATGGFALQDTNDLAGAAIRIAEESRGYYLLGIVPPPGKGPQDWRSLRVSVRDPGLTVRARKGYTLRNAAEVVQAERDKQAASHRRGGDADPPPLEVSRALASGLDVVEIPVRAMALTFGPRPAGRVHTIVALEADLARIANLGGEEHPIAVLSLSVAVTHRDTGEVKRVDLQVKADAGQGGGELEGWLMLSREFDLQPGVNQARVVIRDEFLGRTGAVTVRFVVPAPKGLRLSTPILTDRTLSGRPGRGRPVLLVRRRFATGRTLYCQYEVFGAMTRVGEVARVEASHDLRGAGGVTVRGGGPRVVTADREGRLIDHFGLQLAGLASGRYELVLRVEDPTTGVMTERKEHLLLHAESAPESSG